MELIVAPHAVLPLEAPDTSMSSRRVLKVAQAIRQVVSMAILTELRDPRVKDVTVTFVEVSSDLRHAKVHVSVMGDEASQQLAIRGLRNAAGFLQQKVGDRVDTRYTPRLRFELDQGVKRSLEVSRILGELLPDDSPDATTSTPGVPTDGAAADGAAADETTTVDAITADPPPVAGDDEHGPASKDLDP